MSMLAADLVIEPRGRLLRCISPVFLIDFARIFSRRRRKPVKLDQKVTGICPTGASARDCANSEAREAAMTRPVHPIADLFPMMTEEELANLAADIKANGLIHPIVVDKDGLVIDGRNRVRACEIAGIEPATVLFEGDDFRAYIISSNIARRHMSKGQQAMAVAMVYPEPEKTTHGKKSETKLLLETKTNFSGARLSQARTVLACSTDLARAVLAGTKALDAAYGEAKKAKQQPDGKGVAKSRRAANMRLRKRSAGDHNHEGPGAENPEPGATPELIRDRAYTRQAVEALRLAHENKLAPIDPKEVIRAANAEITETHVEAARVVARAWDFVAKQLERLRSDRGPDGRPP
jgi:ParB-like nuclease domain